MAPSGISVLNDLLSAIVAIRSLLYLVLTLHTQFNQLKLFVIRQRDSKVSLLKMVPYSVAVTNPILLCFFWFI